MTLEMVFGFAVSLGILVLIVLRLSGVVPDPAKVMIPAAPYVLVAGWLVDIIKLIQHPPALAQVPHLWAVTGETIVVVWLSYHEIKTRLLRRRVTIS